MRVYTRIVLGLTILGLLAVISCVYAYLVVDRLSKVAERVVHEEIPALGRFDRFQMLVERLEDLERHALSGVASDATQRAFDDTITRISVLVDALAPLPSPDQGGAQVRVFKRDVAALLVAEQDVAALLEAGRREQAQRAATDITPLRARLLTHSSQLLAAYGAYIERAELDTLRGLRALREQARVWAAVCTVTTLLLCVAGARTVLAPLDAVLRVARRVGRGDLEARVDARASHAFGELGQAFNRMLDSLQGHFQQLAVANTALERAQQEHQQQLQLAQQVQRSIVPRDLAACGVQVFSRMQAAQMIGGDFYDAQVLDGSPRAAPRVLLAVGDASGHGIAAALLMVLTMALLREAARSQDDPSALLAQVNHGLLDQFPNEMVESFVTASVAVLEPACGRLRLANAGNEPPMVWQRREGRVRTVETPGTFLGAFPETRYHTAQMWLEPGDRVVLFSDGLTETRAPNGEFFGRDRLEALVIEGADASVTELGETIIAALQGFREAPAPRDDVAILIAELGPARSDLSS